MKTRKIEHWAFIETWRKDYIAKFLEEGYVRSSWSNEHYVKIEETPMFSSQITPKYIGGEPDNGGKYNTYYYVVSKEQFDAMEVKPKLVKICRPLRLRNYDCVEPSIIQHERVNLGWEEIERTFDKNYRYVYFVV